VNEFPAPPNSQTRAAKAAEIPTVNRCGNKHTKQIFFLGLCPQLGVNSLECGFD
jgi:hypothetical protein